MYKGDSAPNIDSVSAVEVTIHVPNSGEGDPEVSTKFVYHGKGVTWGTCDWRHSQEMPNYSEEALKHLRRFVEAVEKDFGDTLFGGDGQLLMVPPSEEAQDETAEGPLSTGLGGSR